MILEFAKMTGAGNDFIVIDDRINVVGGDARELAKQLCRRRLSVGADGLIVLTPSTSFDFRMRYFNADGTEADMCGNGGRCAAKFAFEAGMANREMTFESRSGAHTARVTDDQVKLAMPDPRGMLLGVDLSVKGHDMHVNQINTGVPHVVCEVDDLEGTPVVELGSDIRRHRRYTPDGTNVDFVKIQDRSTIQVRTYERGVEDETLACGTGATASALVMAALGQVDAPVAVETRGGSVLTIDFYMSDLGFCDVSLEGEASIVYKGQLECSEG